MLMQLKQSEATAARRRIPFRLVDATDRQTAETGITFIAGDIKVSKNGGAEANHAGTVTEVAGGLYYYEAAQAELDTLGFLAIRLTKAGVDTVQLACQVVAFDPYAAANLGLTNLDAVVSTRATPAQVATELTNYGNGTVAQPGQEAPAATQTRDKMLAFLYKGWRNKKQNDSVEVQLFADDGVTVDQKATIEKSSSAVVHGAFGSGA